MPDSLDDLDEGWSTTKPAAAIGEAWGELEPAEADAIFDTMPGDGFVPGTEGEEFPWPNRVPPRPAEHREFPLEVLPAWMREFVESVAVGTQSPSEMAAMLALVSLSAAVAGRLDIRMTEGWAEGLNLYVCCVLQAGTNKTAVLNAMAGPLMDYEAELLRNAGAEKAAFDEAKRRRAGAIKRLQSQVDKAETDEERSEAEAELQRDAEALDAMSFVPPKLICDDATPEALRRLLVDNRGRIALITDEGAGTFSHMTGRYSNTVQTDVYTQGYSNGAQRVDRAGDDMSLFCPRSWLTIGMAIQPIVLAKAMADNDLVGRGVMDRFLICRPDPRIGYRDHEKGGEEARSQRAADARAAYNKYFTRLIHSLPDELSEVHMPDDAARRLDQWMNMQEARLRRGRDLEQVPGAASKAKGQCVRLTGLLHVLKTFHEEPGWSRPVAPETMEDAITLMDWFLHELALNTGILEPAQTLSTLRKVLGKLMNIDGRHTVGGSVITIGNLRRYCGLPASDRAQEAEILALLLGREWLQEIVPDEPRGGRPTRKFRIHPVLRK